MNSENPDNTTPTPSPEPEALPVPAAPAAPVPPAEPVPAPPLPQTAPPVDTPGGTGARRAGLSTGAVIAIAIVVALIVGGLAGGVGGFASGWLASHARGGSSSTGTLQVLPPETDEPVVAAAAAALPSVVNIDVSASQVSPEDSNALPESHPGVPLRGNGSGVAFRSSEDGGTYILTNAHVVENAEDIFVTGTDRERRRGELIGADAETDIAVVKIAASLPLIEIGDSDEIEVGQSATAIGSPFGLSHSVTSGVISAIGRSLPGGIGSQRNVYPLVDVIQTDAAINPGNSGGALVDRVGQLIGVNTAIYSDTGASGGIGFAVPVNTAIRIADQLIDSGIAQHPFLGIIGQDVTPEFAAADGLDVDEGAYVVEPIEGTKAEVAGIVTGDVIVSLNEVPIRSMDDLLLQVRRHRIGEVVTLEIWRGGELIEVEMEVGIKPADLEVPRPETAPQLD
ncbi:MAG: trypsin-like peptidase domain-containing protein [Anaerosomatales bacterium]|nr:trypsin-like peptidase domain-containing protein [Anaerosomatales bacterium]